MAEKNGEGTGSWLKELKTDLGQRMNRRVEIRLNRNRSTFVSYRQKKDGSCHISLHESFVEANPDVLESLKKFISTGSKTDRNIIRDYFQDQHSDPISDRKPRSVQSEGAVYDLLQISEKLNSEYFDGVHDFQIGWMSGVASLRRRVKQVTLGKCYYNESLITIHPMLDDERVPQFFLEFVIFHEICHLVVKPVKSPSGRMMAHTGSFRDLEKTFAHYRSAQNFEKKHLPILTREWHRRSLKRKSTIQKIPDHSETSRHPSCGFDRPEKKSAFQKLRESIRQLNLFDE